MIIQAHIKEFLLFSDKLVLEGFGTIKILKKSAQLIGNKVLPPESVLTFDASETLADDAFLLKLSEAEDISLDDARQKILEFIDEIRFSLDKGDRFELTGIASFYRDQDGKTQLERDPEFVIDYENFGLESFELDDSFEDDSVPEQLNAVVAKEEFVKTENEQIEKEVQKTTEERSNLQKTTSENKTEESYVPVNLREKKNNKTTVWAIVGAVVVLAAAFVLIPLKTNIFDNGLNFDSLFKEDEFVLDDDFSDAEEGEFSFDALVNELESDLESKTQMENALKPEIDDSKEQKVNENKEAVLEAEFHIIAGSFRTYTNAKHLQKELAMEGYPAVIIEPGNGIYRVSAISFNNKNIALKELIHFREKAKMPEAWLMNLK